MLVNDGCVDNNIDSKRSKLDLSFALVSGSKTDKVQVGVHSPHRDYESFMLELSGLGQPLESSAIRRWNSSYAPSILFLSVSMVTKDKAEQMKDKIGFSNANGVSSVQKAGGLCSFWKSENISFTLVSFCAK